MSASPLSSKDSIGMISSLEDLMNRIKEASIVLGEDEEDHPRDVAASKWLGLPLPLETTSTNLQQLKPIYDELLQDIRENKRMSPYLKPLLLNEMNPSTISEFSTSPSCQLLLYFFEFPFWVRSSSVILANDCCLIEICKEISMNRILGKWCRDAIAEHEKHSNAMVASAINLLLAFKTEDGKVYNSKTRKFVQSVVLHNHKDPIKGYHVLRNDLVRLLNQRQDLCPQTVANTFFLQFHTLRAIYGHDEERITQILHELAEIPELVTALENCRQPLGETTYQLFKIMIGWAAKETRLLKLQSAQAGGPDDSMCHYSGCIKNGLKRCTLCKVAIYCSKECQVEDWKLRHRLECPNLKAQTEMEEAKTALARQDTILTQNPGVDYVIFLKSNNHHQQQQQQHILVRFGFQMASDIFSRLRGHAAENMPFAVCRMYDILSEHQPAQYATILRAQLQLEYRIDPLSQEARDTDPTKQQKSTEIDHEK